MTAPRPRRTPWTPGAAGSRQRCPSHGPAAEGLIPIGCWGRRRRARATTASCRVAASQCRHEARNDGVEHELSGVHADRDPHRHGPTMRHTRYRPTGRKPIRGIPGYVVLSQPDRQEHERGVRHQGRIHVVQRGMGHLPDIPPPGGNFPTLTSALAVAGCIARSRGSRLPWSHRALPQLDRWKPLTASPAGELLAICGDLVGRLKDSVAARGEILGPLTSVWQPARRGLQFSSD